MDVAPQPVVYRFGRFTLDLIRGALLTTEGQEIALRPKSFALLRLFVENAGRLLDRDRIMHAVWHDLHVSEDGIVQCVRDIRHGLGDDAQCIIKTVPRRGYIFTADVTTTVSGNFTAKPASVEDDRNRMPAFTQDTTSGVPPFYLVVRPFEALGGHPDDRSLAAGLTEDLMTDLARLPAMRVVDSDIRRVNGRPSGPDAGIRYVVAGSLRWGAGGVQGVDNKLWITVRLVDAESGVYLWADRFSVDLTKTEVAWSEMIGRLVQAIEFSVFNSVTAYRGLEIDGNHRADRLSLQGWAVLQQTHTVKTLQQARTYFEQALMVDPDLADAKAGMAMVSLGLIANFWSSFEQQGEARIEQLLFDAIDSGGPSSRALLGIGLLRRLQDRMCESRMVLQVVIDSDPNNAWAVRQLGYTLAHSGETAAALVEIERSIRLNPYHGAVAGAYQMLAHCHLALDDLEQSIEHSRDSIARNPWLVSTHLGLASALASSGEIGEAKATVVQVRMLNPRWQSVAAVRGSLPYKTPRFLELMNDGMFAGLRRAGMPDR